MSESLPTVLVIASDTVGERMAGSGIRYWNLAKVLGSQQQVTLATPNTTTLNAPSRVTIAPYGRDSATEDERGSTLASLIEGHDVVVAQHLPYLHTGPEVLASRHLVVDLYAPWILEKLEYARLDPARGEPNRKDDVAILNRLLSLGDYFLCASERQRDFWLGALANAGRLNHAHVTADPSFRTLVDVVGFGLPETPPERTGDGIRARFPEIGVDDLVLIWNGGIWNWLDPLTAIRAVAQASDHIPHLRLVFMGVKSPGAQVAEMNVVEAARSVAQDLEVLNRNVFFNEWVPYEDRQNWLLEADAAISLHQDTAEARYAYRTRMLDTLWCGLPTIATDGDVLSDLVRVKDIGEVVPPSEPDAVAAAILRLLETSRLREARASVRDLANEYAWPLVTEPLLRYCRDPWKHGERGTGERELYVHRLERQYTETANYARRLERALADKEAQLAQRGSPRSVIARRLLRRRDSG